jgi:hypothetical protein
MTIAPGGAGDEKPTTSQANARCGSAVRRMSGPAMAGSGLSILTISREASATFCWMLKAAPGLRPIGVFEELT